MVPKSSPKKPPLKADFGDKLDPGKVVLPIQRIRIHAGNIEHKFGAIWENVRHTKNGLAVDGVLQVFVAKVFEAPG